jgi:hypothetical protein
MTRFSFEVPLEHLDDFTEDQDYLFTLSFLYEREVYRKYVRRFHKQKPEAMIILDNSYNELGEATEVEVLERIYRSFEEEITCVVSPDSHNFSFTEMLTYYTKLCGRIGADRVIPVARSQQEVIYYQEFTPPTYLISVPYEFRTGMGPRYLKGTHFLGLNNLNEVLANKPRTCDTGMPIKLALEGQSIQDWIRRGCPHLQTRPEFFDLMLTKEVLWNAHGNVRELRRLLKEGGL